MIDFYQRVEELRNNIGLNKKDFANKLSVTGSNYATLLKGKTANGELAIILHNLFNVNLNWLLTGTGKMNTTPYNIIKNKNKYLRYFNIFSPHANYALIKNDFKKVYNDNPLLEFVFSEYEYPESVYLDLFKNNSTEEINNIALINNQEFNTHQKFFLRDEMPIAEFLKPRVNRSHTYSNILIIKNNLLEKGYPMYDKEYLGALWAVRANQDKVRFTILSKKLNYDFDYLLELDTYGLDSQVDKSFFTDDDIQEIKDLHQKAQNDYKELPNLSIELTYDKVKDILIVGDALEQNV